MKVVCSCIESLVALILAVGMLLGSMATHPLSKFGHCRIHP